MVRVHRCISFGDSERKFKQLSGFDSPRPHAAYSKAFSFFFFETNTVRALFVIAKSGGTIRRRRALGVRSSTVRFVGGGCGVGV
jgi:hypothetical protein